MQRNYKRTMPIIYLFYKKKKLNKSCDDDIVFGRGANQYISNTISDKKYSDLYYKIFFIVYFPREKNNIFYILISTLYTQEEKAVASWG